MYFSTSELRIEDAYTETHRWVSTQDGNTSKYTWGLQQTLPRWSFPPWQKVDGGIWIIPCLWEGKGTQLKHKVICAIRNGLFVFAKLCPRSTSAAGHRWGCSTPRSCFLLFLGSLQKSACSAAFRMRPSPESRRVNHSPRAGSASRAWQPA